MGRASDDARRKVDLARISLGISDELGDRFGRNRWMHQHDVGHDQPSVECSDRCERTASGISPDTKKFFCKDVFHTKATPFMGQNHFWTGFCQTGLE